MQTSGFVSLKSRTFALPRLTPANSHTRVRTLRRRGHRWRVSHRADYLRLRLGRLQAWPATTNTARSNTAGYRYCNIRSPLRATPPAFMRQVMGRRAA
jgi:hypothetical protein